MALIAQHSEPEARVYTVCTARLNDNYSQKRGGKQRNYYFVEEKRSNTCPLLMMMKEQTIIRITILFEVLSSLTKKQINFSIIFLVLVSTLTTTTCCNLHNADWDTVVRSNLLSCILSFTIVLMNHITRLSMG